MKQTTNNAPATTKAPAARSVHASLVLFFKDLDAPDIFSAMGISDIRQKSIVDGTVKLVKNHTDENGAINYNRVIAEIATSFPDENEAIAAIWGLAHGLGSVKDNTSFPSTDDDGDNGGEGNNSLAAMLSAMGIGNDDTSDSDGDDSSDPLAGADDGE